jgi:hypothetical protein
MFKLPDKPSISLKEKKPDGRYYSVVPLRAIHDKRLTRGDLINLITLCSYCSNNGFTFVAYSTMAELRGLSQPNISRGMMKLQKLGYFEIVRKGYTGLRGALKRVIYDEKINHVDQLAISNTPLDIPTHESITMTNTKSRKARTINQAVSDSRITFDEALLVVSHSLKSDSDLLRLEQLVSRGVSRAELLEAFEGVSVNQ